MLDRPPSTPVQRTSMVPDVAPRPKQTNQYPPLITRTKQDQFIQLITTTGRWKASCAALNIEISTPYQWASKSREYRKRLDAAKESGEQVQLKEYEEQLHARIMRGQDDPQSAVLTMFRVKRLDPAYRDNAVVQVNTVGPVAIQLNFGQVVTHAPQAETASTDPSE